MKKALHLLFFIILAMNCNGQILTTVSPTSVQRGVGLSVTISGSNLHLSGGTNSVWFSQGSSTVMYPTQTPQVTSNNTLSVYLQINSAQPTGVYSVHLSNSTDGSLTLPNSFTVLYNQTQAQIASVSPNVASKGQTLNVAISGLSTNFAQGTGTITWFQQGSSTIYPNSQHATTATSLTANYTIPSNALSGYYDTYTYNNTDGFLQLGYSFYVNQSASIAESSETESVEIYPNPASNNFYLNIKSVLGSEFNIQIYNILGKKVFDFNQVDQFPYMINVENFENGVYFVEIYRDNKRFATKKVLINR